jgi:hypothetical protein
MTSSGVTGIGLGMNGMGMTTMGPDGNVDILRRLPQTGGTSTMMPPDAARVWMVAATST